MQKEVTRLFKYALFTFGGLFLGGLFTNPGTASEWYASLDKAPWTPPGWVFGFAWTLIGLTWSVWAAKLCDTSRQYRARYWAIWLLNFAWNPLFFAAHDTLAAGLVIFVLLALVVEALVRTHRDHKKTSLWVVPYALWLTVASSLNWYVILAN